MNILERVSDKTDLKLAQIERELGFGNGTMGRWNKSSPSFDKVIAVANLLNVTTDYLAGREQKEKDSHILNYGESPTKYKIKELVDAILEKNNDEEELNALKILLKKFTK